ncbi:Histone-lysine N-methyltransferase SETMAR [Aphelenchoides fujianensis]|nr:Histone-lysine N-methyltransferase SETMAR [Aphelenchoides fujianensis]
MEAGDAPKTTPKVTDYNTRMCLLYDFRAGLSAADSVKKIHAIFGPEAVGLEGAKTWWKKFRAGNFKIADERAVESGFVAAHQLQPLPQFEDESDESWDAPVEDDADKENAGGHSTTEEEDEEDEW